MLLLFFSNHTPHGNATHVAGRIFGRRLSDLSKLLVSLEDSQVRKLGYWAVLKA